MSDTSTTTPLTDNYQEFLKEQEAFDRRLKSFTDSARDIVKQLDGTVSKERDYKMQLAEVVAEQQTSLAKLRAKVSRLKGELAQAHSERDELKEAVARKRARRTENVSSETPLQNASSTKAVGQASPSRVAPTTWPVRVEVGSRRQYNRCSLMGATSHSHDDDDDDDDDQSPS